MAEKSNNPIPVRRDTLIATGIAAGIVAAGAGIYAMGGSKPPQEPLQPAGIEEPSHEPPKPAQSIPEPAATIGASPKTFAPTSSLNIEVTPAPSGNIGAAETAALEPPPTNKEMLKALINGDHPQVPTEIFLNDIKAIYEKNPEAEQIWSQNYAIHDVGVTGEDQQAALEALITNLNKIYIKTKSPEAYKALDEAIDRAINVLGPYETDRLIQLFKIND